MSNFVKVGAGWKLKKGSGYNCLLDIDVKGGDRIVIMNNKFKKSDYHPDIILGYFDNDEMSQEERDAYSKPATMPDDDIPF